MTLQTVIMEEKRHKKVSRNAYKKEYECQNKGMITRMNKYD